MILNAQSREANSMRLSRAMRPGLNIRNYGGEIIVFDDLFFNDYFLSEGNGFCLLMLHGFFLVTYL